MGTDIHLQVQGRRTDGSWEFVKRKPFLQYQDEGFSWDQDPSGRHYDLFALLGGVRNGSGFAGSYRHEPVQPQFERRGLPDDYREPSDPEEDDGSGYEARESLREEFTGGDFWLGDHSFTWATLTELLSVPWNTEFHSGGIVGPVGFKQWKETGCPESWSGGIAGPGIVIHDDPEIYAKMLEEGTLRGREGKPFDAQEAAPANLLDLGCLDFCFVTWSWRPLEENSFRTWIEGETMTSLAQEYGGTDNIRVIMGFDS